MKHWPLSILSILSLACSYASTDPADKKSKELPRSAIFPPENGILRPLQGKIIDGRYYAPENVFSCQADDFGEGKYLAQDVLLDRAACVGFYNPMGNFKHAEVFFFPKLANQIPDRNSLKYAFESFGIGILKELDNAEGIEILCEDMIDDMFFAVISIQRMSVLKDANGKSMPATRGYLVFRKKDKLVLLSNQMVTLPGHKHVPAQFIEPLKQEILNFRKTFELGAIPSSSMNAN